MVSDRQRRKRTKLLGLEEFEARLCLSSVFFISHEVVGSANLASSVFTEDLDGDGDMDVLSASLGDGKIAWYENTDGKGSFGPQHVITESAKGANSVYAADLDGDGDMDVLSASDRDDKIAWYENTDGSGNFGRQRIITAAADRAASVFAADVDGDGDVDVLSASSRVSRDDKIAWYENMDGKGNFGPQQVISNTANGAGSVYAADVDGDGDIDVLSAFPLGIAWYENTDGKGTFGEEQVITEDGRFALSVHATDLDGDGDVDILYASKFGNRIVWHETVWLEAGDANGDLRFDQLDLVQVLQAARYLTGEPATFEEGDWNGDAAFDQLDLVAALQTGNYPQGSYVDAATIDPNEE